MLISASFGLRKGPPQTCTVARGDPSHFVDALKGFTLMAWMKQSRSDVGIFFVEAFKVRPTRNVLDVSLLKSFFKSIKERNDVGIFFV